MKTFAIIGGGIGGLTLAVALQRKGIQATVYESAPQFKPLGAGLSLASNAMMALANIGIDQEVMRCGKAIKRMYCKDPQANVISFTDAEDLTSRFKVVNNFTIHRADLHNVLVSLLKPGTIQLGKTIADFEQGNDGVQIRFSDGTSAPSDYLIACDGIHSPVRKKLLPASKPRYAGYTCWRAVISELPVGFNTDETTETWGLGRRFGVVPLSDGRVYWFATLNAKENDPKMKAFTTRDLQTVFSNFHFPIPEILKLTRNDQLIWGDIIDIEPIKQFAFGKILHMGDAAHATTPNMGQGACMAIEDAATLTNALAKYSPEDAFRKFEAHRIHRTTQIVNRSWTFGRLAQWENPVLIRLRNWLLKLVPQSTIDKQLKELYDVSFDC